MWLVVMCASPKYCLNLSTTDIGAEGLFTLSVSVSVSDAKIMGIAS